MGIRHGFPAFRGYNPKVALHLAIYKGRRSNISSWARILTSSPSSLRPANDLDSNKTNPYIPDLRLSRIGSRFLPLKAHLIIWNYVPNLRYHYLAVASRSLVHAYDPQAFILLLYD
jgi:hypothetical protein